MSVVQDLITADEIMKIVQGNISDWHVKNERRAQEEEFITDDLCKIRPLNVHRNDIREVVKDLVIINVEMWHEQDKMRSENDDVVLRAITKFNPLNQRRNDLIEEIDEIFEDWIKG